MRTASQEWFVATEELLSLRQATPAEFAAVPAGRREPAVRAARAPRIPAGGPRSGGPAGRRHRARLAARAQRLAMRGRNLGLAAGRGKPQRQPAPSSARRLEWPRSLHSGGLARQPRTFTGWVLPRANCQLHFHADGRPQVCPTRPSPASTAASTPSTGTRSRARRCRRRATRPSSSTSPAASTTGRSPSPASARRCGSPPDHSRPRRSRRRPRSSSPRVPRSGPAHLEEDAADAEGASGGLSAQVAVFLLEADCPKPAGPVLRIEGRKPGFEPPPGPRGPAPHAVDQEASPGRPFRRGGHPRGECRWRLRPSQFQLGSATGRAPAIRTHATALNTGDLMRSCCAGLKRRWPSGPLRCRAPPCCG